MYERGVFMQKTLWKSAIVGGIIAFVWAIFSWTAIGWPSQVFKSFADEQSVANVIRNNAPESGVYLLPNPYAPGSEQQMAQRNTLFKNGPVMFATVQANGLSGMTRSLILAFIIQIVAAYLITWALMKTRGLSYFRKVLFIVMLGGVLVSVLGVFPAYLWKGFPLQYVVYVMVDTIIAWLLAGFAMAKIVGRSSN